MNVETIAIPALVILAVLTLFILIRWMMIFGTPCSKCVHDNYRSEICEHCKYFVSSLRRGYLKYCKSHDKYEPKEGEDNVK